MRGLTSEKNETAVFLVNYLRGENFFGENSRHFANLYKYSLIEISSLFPDEVIPENVTAFSKIPDSFPN